MKAEVAMPAADPVPAPAPVPPAAAAAVEDEAGPPRRDKIVAALARARVEMGAVVREKTAVVAKKDGSGRYEYAYASLDAAVAAAVPALSRHGLFVEQRFEELDTGTYMVTTVWHESGQSMLPSVLRLDRNPADGPRALGALITYMRRYAYLAVLGLAPEDDDGAAAQEQADARRAAGASMPAPSATPGPGRPAPMRPPPAAEAAPKSNGGDVRRGAVRGPTDKQQAMLAGLAAELGVDIAAEAARAKIVVDGPRSASALIAHLLSLRSSAGPLEDTDSGAGSAGDLPF